MTVINPVTAHKKNARINIIVVAIFFAIGKFL